MLIKFYNKLTLDCFQHRQRKTLMKNESKQRIRSDLGYLLRRLFNYLVVHFADCVFKLLWKFHGNHFPLMSLKLLYWKTFCFPQLQIQSGNVQLHVCHRPLSWWVKRSFSFWGFCDNVTWVSGPAEVNTKVSSSTKPDRGRNSKVHESNCTFSNLLLDHTKLFIIFKRTFAQSLHLLSSCSKAFSGYIIIQQHQWHKTEYSW